MNNFASESPVSVLANQSDGISLGLGLTNECNLSCAFCYRDPTRTDRLTLQQVKSVMERLPVRSVNLGTGENGMHPDFRAILAYLRTQPPSSPSRRMATASPFWKTVSCAPFTTSSSLSTIPRKRNRMRSADQATGRSFTSRQPAV